MASATHAAQGCSAPRAVLTPLLDEEKPDELAVGPPSRLAAAAIDGGMKAGTYLPEAFGPCPAPIDEHEVVRAFVGAWRGL